MISCKCGKNYIGETGVLIKSRIKQHQYSIFRERWTDSGLAEHCKACKDGMEWEDTKTLKSQSYTRIIRDPIS